MGRSGGGGGGHSSGGFGGGRSSGGFSGGGRSHGSYHNSSGRSYYSGTPHYHYHTPIFFGGWGPRRGGVYHVGGIWSTIFWFIFFLIIVSVISSALTSNNNVPKNTTQRTALSGVVNKTDWYEDNIGWISNKNTLISGLEDFYNKTGIQPYILFVQYSDEYWNGNVLNATAADQYLEEVYNNKFTDEAHFIFAYFQSRLDSKSEMEGEFRYLSGYSADTIMDNEAISILWGFFEKNYYNTSLSMEKMISNTFSETAERIMSRPTNGWDFIIVVIVGVIIVVSVVIIYKTIKNVNKRAKEKEEYTEKILNTPLETFGTDTSELEKKYEDNNKNDNN